MCNRSSSRLQSKQLKSQTLCIRACNTVLMCTTESKIHWTQLSINYIQLIWLIPRKQMWWLLPMPQKIPTLSITAQMLPRQPQRFTLSHVWFHLWYGKRLQVDHCQSLQKVSLKRFKESSKRCRTLSWALIARPIVNSKTESGWTIPAITTKFLNHSVSRLG